MCPACSLDYKFANFEKAWLKDEKNKICFPYAYDEFGVKHTFRESLITFVQEVMPKEFDWSVRTSHCEDKECSCIYVEAQNNLSALKTPYYFVFNVEV